MSMDDHNTLIQLESLAAKLGILIWYEPLNNEGFVYRGGYCRVKGQDYLIIDRKATTREKIHIFIDALKRYDLSSVYILPSLREILDRADE